MHCKCSMQSLRTDAWRLEDHTDRGRFLRSSIPVEMQGRVYACRSTLQFFTIPIGFFLGGYMVDEICEPIMNRVSPDGIVSRLFGSGKGAGAAMMMLILGILGTLICLGFGKILGKYRTT